MPFRSYKDMVDHYGFDPADEWEDRQVRLLQEASPLEEAIIAEFNADLESGLTPGNDAPPPNPKELPF
jgi:hypothetical protein